MLGKIIKAAIALAITSTFIGGIVAGSFRTMIGASFWRTVAANTVLLGLNYLTTKGSNNTTARNLGTPQAFTNPIAARNTVYGKTRVGGTIVYRDVSLNTKELRQIIAVAAHEINDIKKIFLNNGNETFELSLTTDFSESSGVYTITNTNFVNSDNDDAYGSGGLVKVIYEKGDQTTVNSAIQTAIGSSTWTNDHKLQGIAYIYISCIFDADKWKGYPTFSFEVEGKKVYDPRTSTTVYSTNPALIIRDYLKDTTYGFGAFDSEINDDTTGAGFIKAANDCDDDITLTAGTEDRYTLNGEYTASEEPQKVLETMLSSCAGQLSYNNGKFNLFVGKERTASGTITDDKLLAPVQITTKSSATSLVNGVKASYVNPSNKYQATEIRPYQDSTYLTEDTPSGEASANYEKFMNLSFPYTHTTTTAQRLARIALDYARQDQVLSVVVPIEFMAHQVGDIINLTNDRLGYSGKDFEITSMSFEFIEDNYLALRLNLKEYSTTVFDNISYTEDPTLPDDLDAGDNTVPVPTGLTLTEITKTPSFGDVAKQFYIRANWTNASDEKIAATEVAYKKSTDTVFVAKSVAYGTTRIIESAESDTTYNFKVRHISAEGVAGDYTSVVNITTSSSQGTHSGGTVGGVTVGTDKLYIGTGTFDDVNTPFYVDDTGQFSLKDKLSWNGSTLDISGNLTVENTITADKITLDGTDLSTLLAYPTEATGNILEFDGTYGVRFKVGGSTILSMYGATQDYQGSPTVSGIGRMGIGTNISSGHILVVGGVDMITVGRNLINVGTISNSQFTIPNTAGSAGQVLKWPSSGTTLEWGAATGGSTTTINNNADNRVITGSNTADTLNGEANLTFDGTTLSLPSSSGVEIDITGTNAGNIRANQDLYLLSQNGDLNLGAGGTNGQILLNTSGNATFTGTITASGDITANSGFVKISGSSASEGGELQLLRGTSGTTDINIDNYQNYLRVHSGGSVWMDLESTGINTASYQVSGTTVIDSSRNLTNIGTISSGAHTINTATNGLIFPSSHSEDKIRLFNGGSEKIGTAAGVLVLTGNTINFKKVGGTPNLQLNGTTWLDSSRNLTNIGTISSGQITSTGGGSSSSPTLALNSSTSTTFNHAINAFNSNLTAGENNVIIVGQAGSTKNSGYIGYKWNGSGSNSNLVTFGHWGNDNLMNLTGDGKLGIGTQSPRHTLSVNGTLGSSTFSGFGMGVVGGLATAESGNTNRAIGIQSHATSNAKLFAYDYGASAAIPISIQPDNADVYLCAGGGNVGVGSSGASYTLDVNGTFAFRSTGYAYDSNFYAYNSGSGTYLRFGNDGTSGLLTMTGAQNLSIQGQGSGSTTFWGDIKVGATTIIDSARNFKGIASLSMGDQILRLRGSADSNHFLQFTSSGYSGVTIDGPHLVGYQGGELGTKYIGGNQFALRWDTYGNVTVRSNITAYSDERLKDNIETLDGSKVFAMRGVSFTKDNKAGSGVIAQEIEKIAPELVDTADDDMGTKSVAYGNLVGYLIEAVKELKAEIEELKK